MGPSGQTLVRAAVVTVAAAWLGLVGNACAAFSSTQTDVAPGDGSPGDEPPRADAPFSTDAPDAATEAEGSPAVTGCNGEVACDRLVFVTSESFAGGDAGGFLGGLAGAEAKCNVAAAASSRLELRGRKFVAWLSTTAGGDANVRLVNGSRPYKRVDGVRLADDFKGIVSGMLQNAISRDENNSPVIGGVVWTGTGAAGLVAGSGSGTCGDWSDASDATPTITGDPTSLSTGWTNATGNTKCHATARLYCFEK